MPRTSCPHPQVARARTSGCCRRSAVLGAQPVSAKRQGEAFYALSPLPPPRPPAASNTLSANSQAGRRALFTDVKGQPAGFWDFWGSGFISFGSWREPRMRTATAHMSRRTIECCFPFWLALGVGVRASAPHSAEAVGAAQFFHPLPGACFPARTATTASFSVAGGLVRAWPAGLRHVAVPRWRLLLNARESASGDLDPALDSDGGRPPARRAAAPACRRARPAAVFGDDRRAGGRVWAGAVTRGAAQGGAWSSRCRTLPTGTTKPSSSCMPRARPPRRKAARGAPMSLRPPHTFGSTRVGAA